MERLTEEIQIGPFASLKDKAEAVPGAFATYDCLYAHMVAVTKLKEYEDTGLEPEEVTAIKNAIMGQEIAKITEFDGISIQRLQELAQAEKDGRLVVLPCNIHQPIYIVKNDEIHQNYGFQWHFTDKECQTFGTLSMYGEFVRLDDFGKTVFLTREEAEAALKKREGMMD